MRQDRTGQGSGSETDAIAVGDVQMGSILLLHRRLIHRALDNVTENEVRLSFPVD